MIENPLPMGWQEVAPTGLPSDGGTDPDEWGSTSDPRHPREEVRCWVRGSAYVRICKVNRRDDVPDSKSILPFAVHIGTVDDPNTDVIDERVEELGMAVRNAYQLMRVGGY